MRVIAGSARRLLLKTIEGMDTRPTTDRIKETLFNMLNTQIPGCTFLDLFAGQLPIETDRLLFIPFALDLPDPFHSFPDHGRALTRLYTGNLGKIHRRHICAKVDSFQKGLA